MNSCFKVTAAKMAPAPAPRAHYRRSTTSKAPRKRTFIMNMEKYSPMMRSEGAGGMLCKANASANMELYETCNGGNDGAMGGNGGNTGARPPRLSGGDNSFNGAPQPLNLLNRTILLGAIAIMSALVLLPSKAVASSSSQRSSRVAPHTLPSRTARSMCLSNTANPATTSISEDAIVYGQVQLSEAERRLMCGRQLNFRETLRSEAVCRA